MSAGRVHLLAARLFLLLSNEGLVLLVCNGGMVTRGAGPGVQSPIAEGDHPGCEFWFCDFPAEPSPARPWPPPGASDLQPQQGTEVPTPFGLYGVSPVLLEMHVTHAWCVETSRKHWLLVTEDLREIQSIFLRPTTHSLPISVPTNLKCGLLKTCISTSYHNQKKFKEDVRLHKVVIASLLCTILLLGSGETCIILDALSSIALHALKTLAWRSTGAQYILRNEWTVV